MKLGRWPVGECGKIKDENNVWHSWVLCADCGRVLEYSRIAGRWIAVEETSYALRMCHVNEAGKVVQHEAMEVPQDWIFSNR